MQKVAIIGAGNMGTALAQVVALNGHNVKIWSIEEDVLREIGSKHKNSKYLPGVKLSPRVKSTLTMEECIEGTDAVFFAVPSSVIGGLVSHADKFLTSGQLVVNFSKGLEEKTGKLIHEVMAERLKSVLRKNLMSVSGPSIAAEFVLGKPAHVMASGEKNNFKKLEKILANNFFKLTYSSDIAGTELGGALKNIYAIALGIGDGLGYSANTKAVIATHALREIALFIQKKGGKTESAYGLAGLGDLLATGFSGYSRNRTFGEKICLNKSCSRVLEGSVQVVEGVRAAKIAFPLAHKLKLKLPLMEMVYYILYKGKNPRSALGDYLKNL